MPSGNFDDIIRDAILGNSAQSQNVSGVKEHIKGLYDKEREGAILTKEEIFDLMSGHAGQTHIGNKTLHRR